MEVNNLHLCIGCMRELHNKDVCPHCGLVQKDYAPTPRCLIPGTRLAKRYVLGKVLGEGSFGITYIGWDEVLAFPVAIKEYYPSDLVSRDVIRGNDKDVYMYANLKDEEYHKKLERFLKEARDLTRFNSLRAIVSVRDFFFENNTAYIVMDYVRGESLKSYVKREGAMDAEKVLALFKPVLESLMKVHEVGIIHRDISPDNMLFDENDNLVLIDFGSAELQNSDVTRSVTIMFKRGFSPEEQYRSCGKQGAWTDIYALCATMYYAMTAVIPDESIQRAIEDRLTPLGDKPKIQLSRRQSDAIMKGLMIRSEDRYQKIKDLYEALYGYDINVVPAQHSLLSKLIIAVAVGLLLIVMLCGYFLQLLQNKDKKQEKTINRPGANTTEVKTTEANTTEAKTTEAKTTEAKTTEAKTTEANTTETIRTTQETRQPEDNEHSTLEQQATQKKPTTQAKPVTEEVKTTEEKTTAQTTENMEGLDGFIQ